MTEEFALEYIDKDGEIVVIHFNANGITNKFVSLIQKGSWEDPPSNELYLSEIKETPEDKKEEAGQWYQKIGTVTSEDCPSYELMEDFKDWKELFKLCQSW